MKNLMTLLGAAALVSGCAVGPTTANCVDPPMTKINIVFVKNNEIRVSPGNPRTYRGNVLRFKLTGDSGTNVTISGKASDPDSAWIKGSGMGGSFIFVCVEPDLDFDSRLEQKTYAYDIDVAGVGKLDPEVTVRR
jgi:hypothetical protein